MDKELLNKIMKWNETVGVFVKKQPTEVVEQLLTYEFYAKIVYFIVWSLVLVGLVGAIVYLTNTNKDSIDYILGIPILSLSALLAVAFSIDCLLRAVKIRVAPKLYLIEYFKDLL